MKLKDFLKQFDGMDPELPVCVSDWQEGYLHPSETQAEIVEVVQEAAYTAKGQEHNRATTTGRFIQIGEGR